jgi:tetraacyldisaccharide 4'-kinase
MLLQSLGLTVGDEIAFADHHAYGASDLELVRERAGRCGADVIVTTEKDAGKVAPFLRPGEPVWAVRLGLDLLDGRERFDRLILGQAEPARAFAEAHA